MVENILIALGTVAIAALGGSLLHPFGPPVPPGNSDAIFREAQIDPETLALVQRACQNCHSQNTAWPWYSHVAPISWLIARDVQQARSHMNLSQWQDYSADDRLALLSAIGSAVRNREMPPQRYLMLHPEARLNDMERQQLYRWTRTERRRVSLPSDGEGVLSKQPSAASQTPERKSESLGGRRKSQAGVPREGG